MSTTKLFDIDRTRFTRHIIGYYG